MMKLLFQIVGFALVVIVLISAVLFFLDGRNMLAGELGELIRKLRALGSEAWTEVFDFAQTSGLAEDAAGLLEKSADKLRETIAPHATSKPGTLEPEPSPSTAPFLQTGS